MLRLISTVFVMLLLRLVFCNCAYAREREPKLYKVRNGVYCTRDRSACEYRSRNAVDGYMLQWMHNDSRKQRRGHSYRVEGMRR